MESLCRFRSILIASHEKLRLPKPESENPRNLEYRFYSFSEYCCTSGQWKTFLKKTKTLSSPQLNLTLWFFFFDNTCNKMHVSCVLPLPVFSLVNLQRQIAVCDSGKVLWLSSSSILQKRCFFWFWLGCLLL